MIPILRLPEQHQNKGGCMPKGIQGFYVNSNLNPANGKGVYRPKL